MSRAQITLYAIIGILIIVLALVLSAPKEQKVEIVQPQTTEINLMVQLCLEDSSDRAFENFGIVGSGYNADEFIKYTNFNVAVLFDQKSFLPTHNAWIADIEALIEDEIVDCVDINQVRLIKTSPFVKIEPTETHAIIKLIWPMEFSTGSSIKRLETWETTVGVPLNKVYSDVNSLIEMFEQYNTLDVDTILDTYGELSIEGSGNDILVIELLYPWDDSAFVYRFGVIKE